jgi:snurportin-1
VNQRRLQKVDSSRQLDIFAHLHLGPSDDEDEDDQDEASITPPAFDMSLMSSDSCVNRSSEEPDHLPTGTEQKKKRRKKKKARTKIGATNRPSKWADKCMYAELLEMDDDKPWSSSESVPARNYLSADLESGWLAVSPVPIGKRCLAVTHQSSGIAGIGMVLVLSPVYVIVFDGRYVRPAQ